MIKEKAVSRKRREKKYRDHEEVVETMWQIVKSKSKKWHVIFSQNRVFPIPIMIMLMIFVLVLLHVPRY